MERERDGEREVEVEGRSKEIGEGEDILIEREKGGRKRV